MPLAPRCASTRGGRRARARSVSTSRTGIEEAVKTVTSPDSAASARATPRLADRVAERRGDRRARRRRRPRATPRSQGVAARRSRRSSAPTRRGRRRGPRRRRRRGPARRARGRRRSGGRRGPPATGAAAWTWAGRRCGGRRSGRGRRRSARRAAGRRSGRSRPARAGRRRAGRPAAACRAPRRPRPAPRRGRRARSWRPATITARGAGVEVDRRSAARRAAGAPPGRVVAARGQRLVEHERLAQREVQVHGAGPPRRGLCVGAEGEAADPAQPLGRRLVRADLEEPLRRVAVELELVDRLPGADVAQLGRAVGGEDDQRHARLVRLDHRGQVVRGRRAARARDRGGAPALLGDPEGEEAGAALVDVRPRRQAGRGARARAPAASSASPARCTRRPGRSAPARRRRRAAGGGCRSSSVKMLRPMPADRRPPARLRRDGARLGSGGCAAGSRTLYGRWRPTCAATAPRAPRGRSSFAACVADVLAAAPERFDAVRLLDGRADRAARRARGARAHRAAGARRDHGGHRGRGASARRAAPTTRRSPPSPSTATHRGVRRPLGGAAAVRGHAARGRAAIWREDMLRNDPARAGRGRCAASARGAMAPLWERLRRAARCRRPSLAGGATRSSCALGRAPGRRAAPRRAGRRRRRGPRPAARGARRGRRGAGGPGLMRRRGRQRQLRSVGRARDPGRARERHPRHRRGLDGKRDQILGLEVLDVRLAARAGERLGLEDHRAQVVRQPPAAELGIEARGELVVLRGDPHGVTALLPVVVEPRRACRCAGSRRRTPASCRPGR